MPTNQNAYNSRITDEALEKRFRDTFKSQGGAELVDDLYASGVVVPVVDFTAAAEGSALRSDLQTAWDFSTGSITIATTSFTPFITTPGFWQVDLIYAGFITTTAGADNRIRIYDGSTFKDVWRFNNLTTATGDNDGIAESKFVVFLRSGEQLGGKTYNPAARLSIWYRQIADVSGNLVNPLGFVSS